MSFTLLEKIVLAVVTGINVGVAMEIEYSKQGKPRPLWVTKFSNCGQRKDQHVESALELPGQAVDF